MLNENILETKPKARHKELMDRLDQSFSNPIIHRKTHGDNIYMLLDLNRIWNQIH